MKYVMGTGSRSMLVHPQAGEIYEGLQRRVLELRQEHGDITLISGMAEGWDEAIAKVAIRNGIPLHVYLPNPSHGDYYWARNSLLGSNRISVYQNLVSKASECIVCCKSVYEGKEHSNFVRNRMMIAAADYALVYDGKTPGTKHAINLLKANGIPYEVYPFVVQTQLL